MQHLSLQQLNQQAIKAALDQNWEQALELNCQILTLTPKDIQVLNRLARTYIHLGQIADAKSIYKKVLKIDKYNTVASKNLLHLDGQKTPSTPSVPTPVVTKTDFIEEPGKTKTITLTRATSSKTLNLLTPGILVNLIVKNRHINVCLNDDTYLGSLPDDIAFHLTKLIKLGNNFEAYIKSVTPQRITIFIRETYRSKRLTTPTFS